MKIDIVVPIYNAYNALKDCLTSLEKNQKQANKIILINDASTDVRVLPYLKKIASKNNWQLLNQVQNQGFVKTANKGLQLSNNHTILLNSDTIVTKYWLKAFKQAIKKNKKLGTATPWSNNAEICSFPKFLSNNKIPADLDKFGKTLFKKYKPVYPQIPTAVGFCMLISEQAKQQVGYFDAQHFGHGYGEENDYSLRVTQAGLSNIICDNAYVAHIGNQSFSDLGKQADDASMQRLLEKHPNYLEIIQQFIQDDSLLAIRNNILEIVA